MTMKVMKGLKVALLITCPARASSTKPIGDAHCLRQDHVRQPLPPAQRQAFGRFVLGARHGFDAAAPDLAEVGGDIDAQPEAGGGQRLDAQAQGRQAEIGQRQEHQQRRALHQLYIQHGQVAHGRRAINPQDGHGKPQQAAADEGHDRQHHGP